MLPGLMQYQTSDQLACEALPGLEMDVRTAIVIKSITVILALNIREGSFFPSETIFRPDQPD